LNRAKFIKCLSLCAFGTVALPLFTDEANAVAKGKINTWLPKDKQQWQRLWRFAKAYQKREKYNNTGLFNWQNELVVLMPLSLLDAEVFLLQNNYDSKVIVAHVKKLCAKKIKNQDGFFTAEILLTCIANTKI
jgi:hypothetical protein